MKYIFKCTHCHVQVTFNLTVDEYTEMMEQQETDGTTCPKCGKVSLIRVWNPTLVVYRGTGWGGHPA